MWRRVRGHQIILIKNIIFYLEFYFGTFFLKSWNFDLKNKIKKYDALNTHSPVRFCSLICEAPLNILNIQPWSCVLFYFEQIGFERQLRKNKDKICSKMNIFVLKVHLCPLQPRERERLALLKTIDRFDT